MDPEARLTDDERITKALEAIETDPVAADAAFHRLLDIGLKAMEAADPRCLDWFRTVDDPAAADVAIRLMFDYALFPVYAAKVGLDLDLFDTDFLDQGFAELLRETPKFVALARAEHPADTTFQVRFVDDAEPIRLAMFSDALAEIAGIEIAA